ncbi:MAG TPA: ParB/RepB/Spo0J family partition protein, partial [Longimicrobium sp.]|nr:ParB/RepB/Spo0J family partition protein [Longimicrobium sp.]
MPVVARRGEDGETLLVAGRRRDAGAGYAGTKLAVIVRNISLRDARIAATVENGQREGPSVLGEARQFRDLREKDGMKVEDIAASTGKQQAYVSKRLALLNLPDWAQAMLRSGELTEGTAYDGMARYARVPEPAASEMWATLHRRWPELKREGLTADRIRNALGQIARNLSRSMDPTVSYAGETAPLFEQAAHDAACECKRPTIRLHDTIKPHARCYNVKVWDGLQETARAERRKALQGNGNGHGKANGEAPAADGSTQPSTIPTAAPKAQAEPEPIPRYAVPTWEEAETAFGPKAREHVLTDDHTAAEIKTAPPSRILDVSQLSADVVRIVQSPRPGLFRVVCSDAEALKGSTTGGERAVRERADRLREQDRAAFREAAGAVELRSPEVLAALVQSYGSTPANFYWNTAELLGLGDFRGKDTAELVKVPKRDLTLILQAIALRVMKDDRSWRYDDRTDTARQQLAAECAEDF